MTQQPAHIKEQDLPSVLPIFPLTGVLLLPRAQLPLNIFEPRYLAMTDDALGQRRYIGMVQPQEAENELSLENPPVYEHGCVGRISTFSESGDGRYFITLAGVCRFQITEELKTKKNYRSTKVNYRPFVADLIQNDMSLPLRDQRLKTIHSYFALKNIDADWHSVEGSPDEALINSLSMMCPFAPSEKQALLECSGLQERSALLLSLMEMSSHHVQNSASKQKH
jgi:Lon protease-like protein